MSISTMKRNLRQAGVADLPAVNAVIEAAVMGWNLPERVKRLSLPSYHYDQVDMQHLTIMLVEQEDVIRALAAWETADPTDTPGQQNGLLLHGLYVHPDCQRQGIGKQLLQFTEQVARTEGYAGLLVKAQADAETFFKAHGLQKLPVADSSRHYENRYWLTLSAADTD